MSVTPSVDIRFGADRDEGGALDFPEDGIEVLVQF